MEAVLKQQLRLPFRRQLTHPETIARLNEEKTTWDAHAAALSPASTRAIVSRQLAGRPNDPWLAARGAWLLLEANDFDRAEAAAQAAQRQWPHRLDIRALLCLIRALQGQDARDGFPFSRGTRTTVIKKLNWPSPSAGNYSPGNGRPMRVSG